MQPQVDFPLQKQGGANEQKATPCCSVSTFSAFRSIIVETDICGPPAVPAPLNVRLLCCLTAGNSVVRRGHRARIV